ncbi:MAG TPA: hypothetical protein VKA86_08820 [Candidatus Krumholzibacteria bacterium]|nr:hypothetical protein [Candidatus Krumholzibacteria bacterium]
MKAMRNTAGVVLAVLAATGLTACATTGPRIEYRPFSDDQIRALEVGMTIADVRVRLGAPHRDFEMDMGQDTGTPWTGYVFEYDATHDERFVEIETPKVNRLVFAFVKGDTLLNHWSAEATLSVVP